MRCENPEDELFAYLRDTLYFPQNANLDPEEMPASLKQLADGLIVMGKYIEENSRFVTALANGDLSSPLPDAENTVAAPAKALQATLSHLAWQMERVARGDLKQRVDYLGKFSDSFNFMIERLRAAREIEKRELALAERRVVELSQAKELFLDLAATNQQLVIVTDAGCRTILFMNRKLTEGETEKLHGCLKAGLPDFQSSTIRWEYADTREDVPFFCYSISSHLTSWDGKAAIAHMISDVTQLREKEHTMRRLAYTDALTGTYNRRYGMEHMAKLKTEGKLFSVAFCDLDDLKYCNDNFGHEEGNRYILSCCGVLSKMPITKVICRAGGDEFLVISEGVKKDKLEFALRQAQSRLEHMPLPDGYARKRNLSFGVEESSAEAELNMTLSLADERMYAQKRDHKLRNRNGF